MHLTLTRDSVAMGDDAMAPNPVGVELPDGATLADLIDWIERHPVGARVHGGSTWALRVRDGSGRGGVAVAVLTRDPDSVSVVADPGLRLGPQQGLHLDYLLAQDPAATAALIRDDPTRRNLRLPPA